MKLRSISILLYGTLLLAACTSSKPSIPGFAATPAPTVDAKGKDSNGDTLLVVDKKQLDQDLVWTVWMEKVDSTLYPNLQSGIPSESLIVSFKLSSDKKFIHLLEKKADPNDPRSPGLVDRFPITAQDADSVTFDFSQGLHRRFLKSFEPGNAIGLKVSYSSVYDFANADDVVTFSQMLKLVDAKNSTLIMHHAFRVFKTTSGFQPVKILRPDRLGLMTAIYGTGQSDVEPAVIRRWDIRKPIHFYISSNTPKEFIPSIVEGFSWWNKAFGKEVIQVEVLDAPVSWGNARRNILQWSDDLTVCNGASALGPSEANPITGEIYSGKIIFCGPVLMKTYEGGIEPGTISREEYYKKLMAWGTAHEMGHVLGLEHNFKGKLFKSSGSPQVLNSTVMDYPYPSEIPNYTGVGPSDVARLQVAYLQPGSEAAITDLKKFPICSDDETGLMPDCNRFVHGQMTPTELSERYIGLILSGKPFPPLEHKARYVVMKQWFTEDSPNARANAGTLLKSYPGSRDILLDDVRDLFTTAHPLFLKLNFEAQKKLLGVMADSIVTGVWTVQQQKRWVDVIASAQSMAGFKTLQALLAEVDARISAAKEPGEQEALLRLKEKIRSSIEDYWKYFHIQSAL